MNRLRGYSVSGPVELDRALALGLIDRVGEVGEALMDLGCWRTRIHSLPPGPDLVAALADRPDALAPAPVADPERALEVARRAAAAGVGDRVVTGWANAVVESVVARARVMSWLQAEQYSDLAMLSRNYPGLQEMLPTELAFALRTNDTAAGNAISTARTMAMRLPGTLEALRAGRIDADHAMALLRATCTTTAEVTAAVEADLLPLVTAEGSTITAEQLRRRAVRRVIALDPDGAPDRHRKAAKDRRITRWAEEDGMAGLKVFAPAQQIAAMWEAATALADAAKVPGDDRSLGARRVDALADVCKDILYGHPFAVPADSPVRPAATGSAPADAGPFQSRTNATSDTSADPDKSTTPDTSPTPDTSTTPDASTKPDTKSRNTSDNDCPASGASPTSPSTTSPSTTPPSTTPPSTTPPSTTPPSTTPPSTATSTRAPSLPKRQGNRPQIMVLVPYSVLLGSQDPCELAGHGAITADQARAIIADGVLQRLLYDPASGIVMDYGRTRYEPPESLKQFIVARDQTCRTPGCNQPAHRCQVDHVEPFRPGQPTGGTTCDVCLDVKCLHHHRAKDGGGFTNTRDPDGTTHWTTPLSRKYTLPPPQIIDPTDDLTRCPDDRLNLEHADHTERDDDDDDRFPAQLRSGHRLPKDSGQPTVPQPHPHLRDGGASQTSNDGAVPVDDDPPPF